jgi:lipoprotein NlpI
VLASFAGGFAYGEDSWQELVARAEKALGAKDFDTAIKLAGQAIGEKPDEPAGLILRAKAFSAASRQQEAIADIDRLVNLMPKAAGLLEWRGSENFKLRQFEQAIADFDKECQIEPAREPWHWKRGLAYYYAGRFDKGRDQFERYHNQEDNDVENAVWRVMCMARMKDVGLAKAQEDVLLVRRDPRVPMMEVYRLFAGKARPDDVLAAIERDKPADEQLNARKFYGHLYLGLYHDMTGDRKQAAEHLKTAVKHRIDHFMWDVANVHLALSAPRKHEK